MLCVQALKSLSVFWRYFPHNPAVMQHLSIVTDGSTKKAWRFTKGNYDLNGENNKKALFMECELSNDEASRDIDELRSYWGFCTLK
ncbi:hypothetical protein GCM10007852_02600 [Agaribacter marinus]|uniref:DUF6795 domain-containing protein n=1 Tax=Agaribacter marinus TaxID=1431249 RepID=A0AA37SUE3_9ALTE|nr:hypothetical protein GCM10007852_02600 [Agaribacter marinus]